MAEVIEVILVHGWWW